MVLEEALEEEVMNIYVIIKENPNLQENQLYEIRCSSVLTLYGVLDEFLEDNIDMKVFEEEIGLVRELIIEKGYNPDKKPKQEYVQISENEKILKSPNQYELFPQTN